MTANIAYPALLALIIQIIILPRDRIKITIYLCFREILCRASHKDWPVTELEDFATLLRMWCFHWQNWCSGESVGPGVSRPWSSPGLPFRSCMNLEKLCSLWVQFLQSYLVDKTTSQFLLSQSIWKKKI